MPTEPPGDVRTAVPPGDAAGTVAHHIADGVLFDLHDDDSSIAGPISDPTYTPGYLLPVQVIGVTLGGS